MFPSEMAVLMAIAAAGESIKGLPCRPTDVSGDYVAHLYSSLVRRGYLRGSTSRGHQLTAKGRTAVVELLRRNESRVSDLLETLRKLGIETSDGTKKTEKETVG